MPSSEQSTSDWQLLRLTAVLTVLSSAPSSTSRPKKRQRERKSVSWRTEMEQVFLIPSRQQLQREAAAEALHRAEAREQTAGLFALLQFRNAVMFAASSQQCPQEHASFSGLNLRSPGAISSAAFARGARHEHNLFSEVVRCERLTGAALEQRSCGR